MKRDSTTVMPSVRPMASMPQTPGSNAAAERAEGPDQQTDGERHGAQLGGPSLGGAGAPEVVVERDLAGPAQGDVRIGCPQLRCERRGRRAQRRHQGVGGMRSGIQADHDEGPAPARSEKGRVGLVGVRQRARHARHLPERCVDPREDGAARGAVRGGRSRHDEHRDGGIGRREAVPERVFDRGRLAAADPRRDVEGRLRALRRRQQHGRGRGPGHEDERAPAHHRSAKVH